MSDIDYQQRLKDTGRNDACLCGSGKKYKKCHLADDEAQRAAALKALEVEAKAKAAAEAEADGDEADTKAGKKGGQVVKPGKGQSSSKARGDNVRAKNIPRRGAV